MRATRIGMECSGDRRASRGAAMAWRTAAALLLAGVLLAGCARQGPHDGEVAAADASGAGSEAAPASAPVAGKPARTGTDSATLAYEHAATITLPAASIPARVIALRNACQAATYGECSVLRVDQQGGEDARGLVVLRTVAAGVEPLIGLGSQGGELGERQTSAEDLGSAIRDNALMRNRLELQHARLAEFAERRDVKLADMIALSQQMAEIEAGLAAAQQEAASQQRRVATQMVTLHLQTSRVVGSRNEITDALRDFGGTVVTVIAWMIRAVAVLLPLGLALWGVVALVRAWRRRRRLAKATWEN